MKDFISPAEIETMLQTVQKEITVDPVVGLTLNRQDLQSELVVMAPVATPLRNRIKRMPGNGTAHAFYRLTGNTNTDANFPGTFFGTTPTGGAFAKGGLPTNTDANYVYGSTPYYNLGDIANVTFQDVAQGRTYWNLFAEQIKLRMLNTALMEECLIIQGDSSNNPLVFDGLVSQIVNQGGNILPSSNGQFGVPIIAQACKTAFDNGGVSDTVVMDSYAKAIINKSIVQILGIRQDGAAGLGTIGSGLTIKTYDFGYGDCDLVTSRFIAPGEYNAQSFALVLDFQTQDAKNGGNTIQMVDVDPMNSIDLAILATSLRKLIWETTALLVTAPKFQTLVSNLSYSGQDPFTVNNFSL